jgi:hypothetical protein
MRIDPDMSAADARAALEAAGWPVFTDGAPSLREALIEMDLIDG